MTLQLRSIAETFGAYGRAAAGASLQQRRELGQRIHVAAYPDLFSFLLEQREDQGDGGETGDPELANCVAQVSGLSARAEALVEELAQHALFAHRPLPVVLLAGTTRANGFVEDFEGAPTLFLELTRLPAPPTDRVLVAHEGGHVAHARHWPVPWPETVGAQVFQEGWATALSRQLVPGCSASQYLWMDDAHDAWVEDCERATANVARELLAVLEAPESSEGARFLSARPSAGAGLPVRSGYWVGTLPSSAWQQREAAQ